MICLMIVRKSVATCRHDCCVKIMFLCIFGFTMINQSQTLYTAIGSKCFLSSEPGFQYSEQVRRSGWFRWEKLQNTGDSMGARSAQIHNTPKPRLSCNAKLTNFLWISLSASHTRHHHTLCTDLIWFIMPTY